jgi:hypothetical protein
VAEDENRKGEIIATEIFNYWNSTPLKHEELRGILAEYKHRQLDLQQRLQVAILIMSGRSRYIAGVQFEILRKMKEMVRIGPVEGVRETFLRKELEKYAIIHDYDIAKLPNIWSPVAFTPLTASKAYIEAITKHAEYDYGIVRCKRPINEPGFPDGQRVVYNIAGVNITKVIKTLFCIVEEGDLPISSGIPNFSLFLSGDKDVYCYISWPQGDFRDVIVLYELSKLD